MSRRAGAAGAILLLVAAGCGARSSKPYTAAGTVDCLRKHGFTQVTSAPGKVGFIAAFAPNGGVRARAADGNVLTIAFAADEAGTAGTRSAFKAHATPFYKKRIADILQTERNAVFVWTTAPSQEQIDTVKGCLGS